MQTHNQSAVILSGLMIPNFHNESVRYQGTHDIQING